MKRPEINVLAAGHYPDLESLQAWIDAVNETLREVEDLLAPETFADRVDKCIRASLRTQKV